VFTPAYTLDSSIVTTYLGTEEI